MPQCRQKPVMTLMPMPSKLSIRVSAAGARPLGEFVQVEGLALGERVIVKPLDKIADGAPVK